MTISDLSSWNFMESNISIVSLALPTNYSKSFLPGKSPANVTQVCGSWQAMALAALRSGRTVLPRFNLLYTFHGSVAPPDNEIKIPHTTLHILWYDSWR